MIKEWHAVNLSEAGRIVVGILMCDGEPERVEGQVPMVQFEFSEEDFRLLKRLQRSQYPQKNVRAMFSSDFINVVYKIGRLFTDILGDYERTVSMSGRPVYRIKPAYRSRARELIDLVAV